MDETGVRAFFTLLRHSFGNFLQRQNCKGLFMMSDEMAAIIVGKAQVLHVVSLGKVTERKMPVWFSVKVH
jgi:hypothetical protein